MRALASISMLTTENGGLVAPIESPTRSILIPVALGPESDVTHIGVEITAPGALAPGAAFDRVEFWFWTDNADVYLSAGQQIELWHARIIGSGVLLEWLDD